ncbi:MAG: ABC transporter permease subunit [Clostridia bacterium]|nr:ABC transporter permease subunit [Clostridia bacterium]
MKKFFSKAYFYIVLLFLYLPILTLVIFSFNSAKSRGRWGGFSTVWYQRLFHNSSMMDALVTTVIVALLAAVISTVIGTISAIALHNSSEKFRKTMLNITYIPMMNSDIVTGVSLMMLFTFLRFRLGFTTLLISHITFCIPYVILSVLPKLYGINRSVYEAALDLGATPLTAYSKIIIPDIMPGIISGFLMSLTLSIDDFVISFFNTGAGVQNISILVYSSKTGVNPENYALSSLMFAAVIILLLVMNLRSNHDQRRNVK